MKNVQNMTHGAILHLKAKLLVSTAVKPHYQPNTQYKKARLIFGLAPQLHHIQIPKLIKSRQTKPTV